MKTLDRILQRWRITRARRYIPHNAVVLDIGCADGALFQYVAVKRGVGIDPDLPAVQRAFRNCNFIRGMFQGPLSVHCPTFDAITLLAVLEHIKPEQQEKLARSCSGLLRPNGKVIITVPSPMVDGILDALKFCSLVDGMHTEQHYGFQPSDTARLFTQHGLRFFAHDHFQLGLNNIFVFRKESNGVNTGG